jgi:hypothetical protein
VCRPAWDRGHRIEGETDKPADKAERRAQSVGRDRKIDGHRPALQIVQREIASIKRGAEARIVEPGGVALGGREDRAALALGAAQMRSGGARDQGLPAALGGGEHVGEDFGELVFGRGQYRAQFAHRALLGRQSRDMDQKPAQQIAGGVVPMRLALETRAHHQHVGKGPGPADDIGVVGIERVEPV